MCERERQAATQQMCSVCILCVFTVQDREESKGFACRAVLVA